jgi:hypothetical protein
MSVKTLKYHVWEDGFGIFDLGLEATHEEVKWFTKMLNENADHDIALGGGVFEVIEHPGPFRKGAVIRETILESFFQDKGT